jgi:hypothetical protein
MRQIDHISYNIDITSDCDILYPDELFLALKTNLIREGMSEQEQGKVFHQITENFNICGAELAKRIGKNPKL